MYCKNCGQPVPDNSAFCNNCGSPQQSTTTPTPQQPPQTDSYSSDNNAPKAKKWYENTAVIILLLIFFFPVGLFLMWKYSRFHFNVKMIISIVVVLFAFLAFFNNIGDSENNPTETTTISQTETTTVPVTSAEDKDVSALTSISNLTPDEAKEILKDLKAVGIDHIDKAVINGSQSNADAGASFTVSYNGYSAILIVIERKTDFIQSGDITLFKNGKAIDNITNYTFSDSEKGEFIYYAKEYVKQRLKAPSTAEFPGTVLEIGEWKVSRNKDVVTVRSYVDSQNSFGAMIRSNFAVQMSYSDKTCLYMEIDGTVMYGEPQ